MAKKIKIWTTTQWGIFFSTLWRPFMGTITSFKQAKQMANRRRK